MSTVVVSPTPELGPHALVVDAVRTHDLVPTLLGRPQTGHGRLGTPGGPGRRVVTPVGRPVTCDVHTPTPADVVEVTVPRTTRGRRGFGSVSGPRISREESVVAEVPSRTRGCSSGSVLVGPRACRTYPVGTEGYRKDREGPWNRWDEPKAGPETVDVLGGASRQRRRRDSPARETRTDTGTGG